MSEPLARVASGTVVSFRYVLKNSGGELIDETGGDSPLAYVHGSGRIFPGLEKAMDGRALGERFSIAVAPEDGYGPRDANKVGLVPRAAFPADVEIEVGMKFLEQSEEGESVPVWIRGIEGDKVVVDGNHPLCGEILHFDIEVVSIREATAEERERGFVSGGGGELG